jgi:solute carrier family 25 citrate transporter 1
MAMTVLLYGAITGFLEASLCHPLDTIKTRIQNRTFNKIGIIKTVQKIYYKEGVCGFYHGLGAVYVGIIPKNAIRFFSFETYHQYTKNTFLSGILAGITEAILVVNPTEVCKIRIQAQYNSVRDTNHIKYKTIHQTFYSILTSEGVGPFYRGVIPTIIRQSVNQGTNFFTFYHLKNETDLPSFIIGAISGSIGPILNNPIDVIKTRMQASTSKPFVPIIMREIYAQNGWKGFYTGLGSRLLRIVPGQAITFGVYEYLKKNS